MELYSSTGCAAQYVIVLTKIDKTDGKVRCRLLCELLCVPAKMCLRALGALVS